MVEVEVKRVPTLRFPEFEGEWLKYPLKKIISKFIDCEHKTAPYIENSKFLVVRTNNVKDGQLLKEDIKYTTEEGYEEWTKRGLPQYGDILFTREAPAGESCLVPDNTKLCLGQRMVLLRPNNKMIIGSFLSFCLLTKNARRNISNLSIGSTVTRINIFDIYKIECHIPTLPEQQKIAAFLTTVDTKLQAFKKKKALLEQYKKSVMQKIFSQELRFTDEHGNPFPDWNKKKLGEITYKTGKKNKENIKYPIYSINNKEGFLPQSDQFEGMDSNNRGYDISLYKIIHKNTFAYNPARINVGSIGYSGQLTDIIISSLYVCFKTTDLVDDQFFLHYLDSYNFKKAVLRNVEGGVREYLFYENFSNIRIHLPSVKEQTKIANFLSAIDQKISKVNIQIQQMEQWKKGLLQKMFI